MLSKLRARDSSSKGKKRKGSPDDDYENQVLKEGLDSKPKKRSIQNGVIDTSMERRSISQSIGKEFQKYIRNTRKEE